MKKLIAIVLAVTMLATFSGVALAAKNPDAIDKSNGAPSGPHYNLNIIGVKNPKSITDCGNGHRIFVQLGEAEEGKGKTSRIYLAKSDGDFYVDDCNATSGDYKAKFYLPTPDANGDGYSDYSIYVRPVGKPGGWSTMTTCLIVIEDDTEVEYCSTESVVSIRTTGKSKFVNVTTELLTICVDWDGDGVCDERVYIFDDRFQDYLWKYDNNGLKVLQLRFYYDEYTELPPAG